MPQPLVCSLGQVVTERGKDHVVDADGRVAGIRRAAVSRPKVALDVAVLEALAKAALGSVVEVEPVACGELLDVLVAAGAAAARTSGIRRLIYAAVARVRFNKAARHGCRAVAVT